MRTHCLACWTAVDPTEHRSSGSSTWSVCPSCGLLDDIAPVMDQGPIWYAEDGGILPEGWAWNPTDAKIARVLAGEVSQWRDVVDGIVRLLPPPGPFETLLDVGCGAGEILDYAKTLGRWHRIEGTEVYRDYVAFTRSRGHTVHYYDLAQDPPIAGLAGWVTLAICNEVMEHVLSPVSLLRAIRDHLHQDGVLFATFAVPVRLDPGEWHYWTPLSVAHVLRRSGLFPVVIRENGWRIEVLAKPWEEAPCAE